MRYGVISDIHGNLPSLEAALGELERANVDAYACAGDLVGYGPQPNECVEVVARLGVHCVGGNHDLIAVGALSDARCERIARESLRWTSAVLADTTRGFLSALPGRLELPGGLVLAHGSLDDPQEYVLNTEQAAVQLARLRDLFPDANILVLGHTHRAFASDGSSRSLSLGTARPIVLSGAPRWVLNAGAVGQSRERSIRARCLVLDLERREATFHAVRYDVRRTRTLLRSAGQPTGAVHLPPWRLKALLRPAIRLVRTAQARARHRRGG